MKIQSLTQKIDNLQKILFPSTTKRNEFPPNEYYALLSNKQLVAFKSNRYNISIFTMVTIDTSIS